MFRLPYISFCFNIFIATRSFLYMQQICADFGCPKSNPILGVCCSCFYCQRQFECPTVFLPLFRGMLLNKLSLVKSLSWRSWLPLQHMRRCHGSMGGSLGKSQNIVSSLGQETMENFCECFFFCGIAVCHQCYCIVLLNECQTRVCSKRWLVHSERAQSSIIHMT